MTRRLKLLMLGVAIVVSNILSPCIGQGPSCPIAWVWQKGCCNAKEGIATPPCCTAKQQINAPIAVSSDRTVHSPLIALPAHAARTAICLSALRRMDIVARIDARAGPPGGSLLAQRTSLVL